MRNLYNGRTERPVGKSVAFHNVKDAANFVNLYKDLFYKPDKSSCRSRAKNGFYTMFDSDGDVEVVFTIFKDDWKEINKHMKLRQYGRRSWVFEGTGN